ncbi:hypothetical protein EUGRSUZ_G01009 [Eucalyptus grandis]|uniref:Uncharacterized protein n=2 Tax=Eucalyptus grandis TaxID=71139 RepID=A0ACC3K1L0_EUCGR|nr:hypothetical protein EUGRSUZ_G01009 [Eucalyptus grandis]
MVLILSLSIPSANSESFDNISFNFPSFQSNDQRITFQGNASVLNPVIQLTLGAPSERPTRIIGRAIYHQPMHLWHSSTGNVADFVTQFTFAINSHRSNSHADGLVFFLAPNGSQIPEGSEGGSLGLTGSYPNSTNSSTAFVAVEFDTFYNRSTNQSDPLCYHVGIDVNSLISVSNTCVSWMNDKILLGQRLHAQVTYNYRAMNLSVVFRDDADNYTSLYYQPVNLTEYLPEWVVFGFSAATGQLFEAHTIFSWEFNSSLRILDNVNGTTNATTIDTPRQGKKSKSWVKGAILGLSSLVFLILIAGFGWYGYKLKRNRNDRSGEEEDVPGMDEGFEQSKGPKKYSYKVLAVATDNFANARLLGKGGFGGVYEGHLADANSRVAVKKITPDSQQGIKEYATEVKTIRHLRHKNLVELVGWCHEGNKFILVYEYMSNGSLDSHLFEEKTLLTWEKRYNIAQGIAEGLKYLHEDLKQCVVHRDIKSSNILLDVQFEAKLGDFGLARIVDRNKGSQTTLLAGTMGYLAPECVYTGKTSKESDVYSFGVVLLEIACGRRAIEPRASQGQIQLVEWVWELYGIGKLFDAADLKLGENFDSRQMEYLMIVGLWCTHPDPKERPPISKAITCLNFDASPPILPPKLPIPTYIMPPSSTPESSHVMSISFKSSEPPSAYGTELSATGSS